MSKIAFKKNISYFLFVVIFSGSLFLGSCERDDTMSQTELNNEFASESDGLIVLGKKLENPYTVENMQKAYDNLSKENKLKSTFQIETTDLYVRFAPANEEEWQLLRADSLELFDMPLDYELEEGGTFYQDQEIAADQITWQYTVVPVNYNFSEIKHEVLAELFLQDEEEDDVNTEMTKSGLMENDDWANLEDESLKITGNYDPDDYTEEGSLKRRWRPSGQIKVEDDYMGVIPLAGVRVVVKRWFKWKHDITDKNGKFSTRKFRSKRVKYGIKWERRDFDIRSGSYGQAWYSFVKKKKKAWNLTIYRSSTPKSWLYAHIHRAAITYFYDYGKWGLTPPPRRKGIKKLKHRLHIAGKDKSGRSHYFNFNRFIWSAQVVVYSKDKSGRKEDSRDVFGHTIHELAHVVHWSMGYSTGQYVLDALTSDPKLPESWAVGVEWKVTNDIYNKDFYNIYEEQYQEMSISAIKENKGYTPLVIDLIDNENQKEIKGSSAYPDDKVSGYTLSELEKALPGALGSWWRWRTRIKEKYNNPTEQHVDYLFRTYNN
jgi:hypothetical protein